MIGDLAILVTATAAFLVAMAKAFVLVSGELREWRSLGNGRTPRTSGTRAGDEKV